MDQPDEPSNGAQASRDRMIALLRRYVHDEPVLLAMASVPRERFVPPHLLAHAYDDRALPIGAGQTISQPLMVALMLGAMEVKPSDRVLDVGTGSGYTTALLSRMASNVVTVERVAELMASAERTLRDIGCQNIEAHVTAEGLGWAAGAPYDAIMVSAGAPHVPRVLLDQLAEGGRLVVPIGSLRSQELVRARRTAHGLELQRLGPCAFVPLIGQEAWHAGYDDVGRINVR